MPAGYTSVAGDMTGLAATAGRTGDGRTCHDRGTWPRIARCSVFKDRFRRGEVLPRAIGAVSGATSKYIRRGSRRKPVGWRGRGRVAGTAQASSAF
jgi:hypothetical protein